MPEPSEKDLERAEKMLERFDKYTMARFLSRIRLDQERAIKQAEARGMRDGLRKALGIMRFLCKNACDAYRDVYAAIQKATGKGRE